MRTLRTLAVDVTFLQPIPGYMKTLRTLAVDGSPWEGCLSELSVYVDEFLNSLKNYAKQATEMRNLWTRGGREYAPELEESTLLIDHVEKKM